ncbi:MAG: hypothetical protein P4L56_27455 [Candidatus Sulfopaludibacter sp.]|nr:hypothetical protein [Candidatus Sulfopaludibacter sp.]
MNSFARFYARVAAAHFLSYVIVGAVSYMLIMRYCLPRVPPDVGLRAITSTHVQIWLWPAQFVRALVIAAAFYPLRDTLHRAGRLAGLLVAGLMVGIGCLAGFNGLIENLIFYRNVSLYLYYIHIPEILAQTLTFGYLLMWLETSAARPHLQTLAASDPGS